MNKKKILFMAGGGILIIVLSIIGLIVINVGSFFKYDGEPAFLDYEKEVQLNELVEGEEFIIRFSHSDKFGINYDEESSDNTPTQVFELSHKSEEISIQNKYDDQSIKDYLDALEKNPRLTILDDSEKVMNEKLVGEIKNSRGDKLEWVTNKEDFGNLLLTKVDGTTSNLLTGDGYKFSIDGAYPMILNATFLTDDLIVIEVRGNLEVMKMRDICEEETPLLKKISMISPCSFERLYFTGEPNKYTIKSSKFDEQFKDIYDIDSAVETYMNPLIEKNSIVIMNLNNSRWSELTVGFSPVVEE